MTTLNLIQFVFQNPDNALRYVGHYLKLVPLLVQEAARIWKLRVVLGLMAALALFCAVMFAGVAGMLSILLWSTATAHDLFLVWLLPASLGIGGAVMAYLAKRRGKSGEVCLAFLNQWRQDAQWIKAQVKDRAQPSQADMSSRSVHGHPSTYAHNTTFGHVA